MTTKVIVKQLAAEEDLLLGEGQITQTRNGQAVPVTKLALFKIVHTNAELQALDTAKFKHATLVEQGYSYDYYFDGATWLPLYTLGAQFIGPTPPTTVVNGTRWYDTESGRTYIYYDDGDSAQWVEDNPQSGNGDVIVDMLSVARKFKTVAEMASDEALVEGQIVETISYHGGSWGLADKPRGGNHYIVVPSGTGVADGGSLIDLPASGLMAKGMFIDGVVRLTQFGAVGDTVTNNTSQVYNCIHFCLTNNRNLYVEAGRYKFTSVEFNAGDYTAIVGAQFEKGIEIYGENRVGTWLDGEIQFSSSSPYVNYGASRFSGMQFRNLMIYNTSAGDGLVLSGYGRVSMYNVLTRAASGTGLALLGGSEFAAYGCQLQGSFINLKVRPTTKGGETVDASAIDFWNCDIANTAAGGKTVDVVGHSGRFINFHGGNIITAQEPAYFENAYIGLDCVNTESNGHPMIFDTCVIQAKGCEFALGSPKFELTNSHFQDLGNLWSANETRNIVLEDGVSSVTLTAGRNYPTIFLNHTGVTSGQVKFRSSPQRFVNDDISRHHYLPFGASAAVTADTSSFKTAGCSLGPVSAGTYLTLPLRDSKVSLDRIDAIEYIATSERLQFVSGGSLLNASNFGIVFRLQDFGDGFSKYLFICRSFLDISQIRYTFASTSDRFDSVVVHANGVIRDKIVATVAPTTGLWQVGDEVEVSTPVPSGYRRYVCTSSGRPGVWKGWGEISA